VPSIQQAIQERIRTCMAALRDISKVWPVAKMVTTLFECILGNRVLEERLQKAPGKRQQKHMLRGLATHQAPTPPVAAGGLDNHHQRPAGQSQKRKYDEMALGFNVQPPQPLESYERSRPQTPSMASAKLPEMATAHGTHGTNNSHNNNTSANTDMPMFFTQLAPPPPQSQSQPHAPTTTLSSEQQGAAVGRGEGAIDNKGMPPASGQVPGVTLCPTFQAGGAGGADDASDSFWGAETIGGVDSAMVDGLSPSDSWSSGSAAGQPMPSTLNVEDWYVERASLLLFFLPLPPLSPLCPLPPVCHSISFYLSLAFCS